jgi:hypothetical protein
LICAGLTGDNSLILVPSVTVSGRDLTLVARGYHHDAVVLWCYTVEVLISPNVEPSEGGGD